MSLFKINNIEYDVGVRSLEREAIILNGENAGQLKNGTMIRDVIGTVYNYALEALPKPGSPEGYDNLYEAITAPLESYPVIMPFGQGNLEFAAYVASANDDLWHMRPTILNLWDGLAFTAMATEPQRYYGEAWSIGSGSGNQVFTIDGVGFNVLTIKLERFGKVQDRGGSGRSISGVMGREIIGTYYNYSMKIMQYPESAEEYDRLYYALTAPVDSHALVVPYGQSTLEFQAYVTRANDQLILSKPDLNIWGNLEVEFTAMTPERV